MATASRDPAARSDRRQLRPALDANHKSKDRAVDGRRTTDGRSPQRAVTPRQLARGARLAPVAVEALVAYARARRRIAQAHDVRALVAATRKASGYARATPTTTLESTPIPRIPEARRLGHAVALTLSILPMGARCLVRSLVLIDLLARRDIDATLVLGARSDGGFRAHAWVELGGQPLLSPADYASSRLVEL